MYGQQQHLDPIGGPYDQFGGVNHVGGYQQYGGRDLSQYNKSDTSLFDQG